MNHLTLQDVLTSVLANAPSVSTVGNLPSLISLVMESDPNAIYWASQFCELQWSSEKHVIKQRLNLKNQVSDMAFQVNCIKYIDD